MVKPLFLERLCEIFRRTGQMIHQWNLFPTKSRSRGEEANLQGLAQWQQGTDLRGGRGGGGAEGYT